MNEFLCITPDVKLGKDVRLAKFINLYGCEIGDATKRRVRTERAKDRFPAEAGLLVRTDDFESDF